VRVRIDETGKNHTRDALDDGAFVLRQNLRCLPYVDDRAACIDDRARIRDGRRIPQKHVFCMYGAHELFLVP
jgi:hypothetical protein